MNSVMQRVWTDMKVPLTCILALVLLPSSYGTNQESLETYFTKFVADLWLEGADVVRIIWRDCSKKLVDLKDVIDHKEYFPKFVRCMKRKTLRALDRSLAHDVVPLGDGVSLVRFELVDPSGNVMPENDTSTWSDKEFDESDWRTLALQRMAKVLRTHVIKFDFDEKNSTLDTAEFRGRRRHHMLTMMVFGIVSIGMVLVPMGFQFLAVLGGKALLLAKMALILASIQGLKKVDSSYEPYHERGKIATSPVSYGFYHTYPTPYDHYQKRSQDDWPAQATASAKAASVTSSSTQFSLNSRPSDTGKLKTDRVYVAEIENKLDRELKTEENRIMEAVGGSHEPRQQLFPVYIPEPAGSIEAPSSLVDLTTIPGEVQADLALDLPYNRFRFQNPTSVISA